MDGAANWEVAIKMRRFVLQRDEDVGGVSGTGVVAEGVEFADGTAVIRWLGEFKSTAVFASVEDLVAVHGHEGRTSLVFWPTHPLPPARPPAGNLA